MNTKQLIAVLVVAIVVIAGVATVAMLNNDGNGNGNNNPNLTGDYLVVYGNANGDAYLDDKDVKFIQEILDGNSTWNKRENPYADTDNDGSITENDVSTLKKFLNGESATMYYTDWNNKVDSISYPLDGKIAVTQAESVQIGIIVGYYDNITHFNRPQAWIDSNITDDMYPGLHDKVISTGDYNLNIENVVSSGISVLFGEKSSLDADVRATLKSYDIDVIALPCMMNYGGMDWTTTIVTVGVMMDKQENTADYVEYLATLQKTISDKATSLGDYSFVDIYGVPSADATTVSIQTYGEDGSYYGDVSNMTWLGIDAAIPKGVGNGYINVSMEDVITSNPDVVLILARGIVGATEERINEVIGNSAEALKNTNAYNDKNIFYLDWNIIGGPMGIAIVQYLASLAWPDIFDQDEALKTAQDYFDKFSLMNVELKDILGILPVQMK